MKKIQALVFLSWVLFMPLKAISRPADSQPPAPSITYVLSMPQPQTHYFEVEMRLSGIDAATNLKKNGYVDVKMPVWTPGSYLIREYAKNVEGFRATAGGRPVRVEKIRKNTWRVYANADPITLNYKVYAYELSVRTSYIDESHGYLNGASIFTFVDPLRNQPHRLIINPYKDWKKISTGLKPVNGQTNTFEAADYDVLVDSPIEIGNHRTFSFTAAGVPHTVAMYGEGPYDEQRVSGDMKKICEAATAVIGEHPCENYTFIVHQTPNGGGGLEHANSTTLQVTRNAFSSAAGYQGFLGLVAHEYFHLWNVKRIRPKALGPFDYENENYTNLLWVAEGITSFYDTYLLRRAGFQTPAQYMTAVADEITDVENQPGNRVQSVTESSFDAWIKYYRPNENSSNSTISYYSKGSILGGLLNLTILSSTGGQKSLDDLMRYLYAEYYKKQKRGFTDDEFQQAAETVAGRKLDEFFRKYVYGTETIDYNAFFRPFGVELLDVGGNRKDPYLGASTRFADGKLIITAVRRDSPAWNDGLNVNDELVAINGTRVGSDLSAVLASAKSGDMVDVLVNRAGALKTLKVKLGTYPLVNYQLIQLPTPTPEQRALSAKWLFTSNA